MLFIRKGIRFKFLVYFVLISIIPLVAVSVLFFLNARNSFLDEISSKLSGTLVLRKAEINRWLSDLKNEFEDVANIPGLGDDFERVAFYHPPLEGKEFILYVPPANHDVLHEKILEEKLKNIGTNASLDFFEFFIMTTDGEVHVSTDPIQLGRNKNNRPYFMNGLEETFIQAFYFSPTLEKPAVTMSTPLRNSEGDVVGVLAGRLKLDRISRIVEERTGLGDTGETYIVNSFKFLMTSARYEYPFTRGMFTGGVLKCLEEKKDGVDIYENYKGTAVIGAHEWIPEYNACLIAEQHQEEALFIANRTRDLTVIIGVVVAGMSTILGVWVARSLINPIKTLQEGAKEIGAGNLDYRFFVKTKDELQDLGESLDVMRIRLKEIRKRERTLAQTKSEFVRIAAHRLRTPLSAIKWAFAALTSGDFGVLTLKQKKLLKRSSESTNKLIELVSDLLDVSRIEEAQFGYKFTRSDLVHAIEVVIDNFELAAEKKRIRMILKKVPKNMPDFVFDQKKIELVLNNLIENAIQYSKKEGLVEVSVEIEGNFVRVSVKDKGIGIPSHEKSRIFEKFFRGENAALLETEGTGLGLFIAGNIIKGHGGSIKFESEEGVGSTFSFTMPLKASMIPAEKKPSEKLIS